MPIYDYECRAGHKFDAYKQMHNRYEVICPVCGEATTLVMSPVRSRVAQPIPVYLHDGTKVHEFRDSPSMRPPTPPEKLVQLGELPNNADRFDRVKKSGSETIHS